MVGLQILMRLILAVGLFASAVTWGAPPVLLASLFVGGSCLPLWWSARRTRRLEVESSALSSEWNHRLAERLAEQEDRHLQDIAELEDRAAHGQQVTSRFLQDLADRLDLLEHLLRQEDADRSGERRSPGIPTPA